MLKVLVQNFDGFVGYMYQWRVEAKLWEKPSA